MLLVELFSFLFLRELLQFLLQSVCRFSGSVVPDSWDPMDQASLSMGFSRQEYWSELPFPPPNQCVLLSNQKKKILNEELLHLKNTVINTTDPWMAAYYLEFSLAV